MATFTTEHRKTKQWKEIIFFQKIYDTLFIF